MYQTQLQEIGLSPLGAVIYEFLSNKGSCAASHIARQTGIQRSMVYMVLKELRTLHLVSQDVKKKVARFEITNPENLNKLVQKSAQVAVQAESAYSSISEQLKRQFAIQSGQPGVRFYEGIEGLKYVYQDINTSDINELWVVRSKLKPSEDLLSLIREQRNKQIQNSVKVKVINSTLDVSLTKNLDQDEISNTERRIVSSIVFSNPAQVLIYNNKIAFTTYHDPMMTTLIEHEDIAETIRSLYSITWQKTLPETQAFLKKHKG